MAGCRHLLMELLILLGALGLGSAAVQTPAYDDTPAPAFLNPSWMAGIPDDRPLSEVTLPGTHNAMALYGGSLAECQAWPLPLQLRAGIRFIDIRVRHARGNLTIHHGISYQWAHFGEVLEGVAAFLSEYPTETVLMRLREELSETGDIYDAVVRYVHRYARWDLLWHSRVAPTVGQARGKLIVLQEFSGPALGMRYDALHIADDWSVPSLHPDNVDKKWRSVHEHLEVASTTGSRTRVFLTYASGASILTHPNSLAKRVNPRLHDYLTAKAGQSRRFGIITTDFPAAPLLQAIIDFN